MNEELLSALRYELGEVTGWEELCPGVYSLTVQPDSDSVSPCSEYYLVLPGAPISREALALGRVLDGIPGLLYAIDPPDEGGWTAILYELCKNQSRHGSPPLEGWSLSDAAMEGMELCPSYFGSFPVPPYTPWGWTLRYKALDNGVYWLETSQRKTALAVCHPIWSTEFSEVVAQAGKKLAHSKADDVELSYLFFEERASCTAIFELLKVRPEWLETGLIRRPELMNAIWKYAPMYATAYNAQEQAGLHDGLGILLKMMGEDSEPQGSPEHMISLVPDTGTEFIGFWK